MNETDAAQVLRQHILECGALMPIEWIRQNGDGSDFQKAMSLAIQLLDQGGGATHD